MRFNNKFFGEIIDSYVRFKKPFDGSRVNTREQMYIMIGEKLHQAPETVRGWRKPRSNGPNPKDPQVLKDLEVCLGLEEGELLEKGKKDDEKTVIEKETGKMSNITDFQRIQIMECYEKMKNFVIHMDMQDENKFYNLRYFIECKKLALPNKIYKSLICFIDSVVAEYVFSDLILEFKKDEAEENANGIVELKTEEATKELLIHFVKMLGELDNKIDIYAEENLKEFLMQ